MASVASRFGGFVRPGEELPSPISGRAVLQVVMNIFLICPKLVDVLEGADVSKHTIDWGTRVAMHQLQ